MWQQNIGAWRGVGNYVAVSVDENVKRFPLKTIMNYSHMYSWCWQKKKVDTFDKRLYVKWKDDLLKRNGADVLKKKNYACPALILFCYLYLQEQGVQNKWKSKIINMYTVIHCKQCTLYNLGSAFFPELTHSYKNICFSVCDEWLSIYVQYCIPSCLSGLLL